MKKIKEIAILCGLALLPNIAFAAMPEVLKNLLTKIANLIINPIILLGFVIATIYFFYSIVELIYKSDSTKLDDQKQSVKYGVIGLFVMFSVYGILRIVLATFKIPCEGLFFC